MSMADLTYLKYCCLDTFAYPIKFCLLTFLLPSFFLKKIFVMRKSTNEVILTLYLSDLMNNKLVGGVLLIPVVPLVL